MATTNYQQLIWSEIPVILGGASELAPNKFVYLSSEGTVQVATASTGAIGIALPKPVPSVTESMGHAIAGTAEDYSYTVADELGIVTYGVVKSYCESGKTITVNDWLEVGANGYVQKLTDPGHQPIGKALASATSTNEVKIMVMCSIPPAGDTELAIQTLSANGAVTFTNRENICNITKGTALAGTLAAPTTAEAGWTVEIIAQTAVNHVITEAGGTVHTLPAQVGARLKLRAYGTTWQKVLFEPEVMQQTLTGNGAVDFAGDAKVFEVYLNKTSAIAATLANPAAGDAGKRIKLIAQTAYAHTLTIASVGLNANAAFLLYTFMPTIGDMIELVCVNAATPYWALVNKVRTPQTQELTGDGAIALKPGFVKLNKAGAIAATLASPTLDMDGDILSIESFTAQTHTVTITAGFNGWGASYDVGTYGGAIQDQVVVQAFGGVWYVISKLNVTIA